MKLLFPRTYGPALTGVILNTAGGITGGDQFEISARAGPDCRLTLTTQAAERAYRAQTGETAQVRNTLEISAGARIDWVPQETLLYDNSDMRRSLHVDMAQNSELLLVEPVVFGRTEMGETLNQISFRDRIDIRKDGHLVFSDRTLLDGTVADHLGRSAIAAGNKAMANVVFASNTAGRFVAPAREMMPDCGGVSLIREGLLFARILAEDSFTLRRSLLSLIELLGVSPLPRVWMI